MSYSRLGGIACSALTLLFEWQEGHLACKNWVVGCRYGYLLGARCRFAYGPADATATHYILLWWVQIGFTFLVQALLDCPRHTHTHPFNGLLNGCVYVCMGGNVGWPKIQSLVIGARSYRPDYPSSVFLLLSKQCQSVEGNLSTKANQVTSLARPVSLIHWHLSKWTVYGTLLLKRCNVLSRSGRTKLSCQLWVAVVMTKMLI